MAECFLLFRSESCQLMRDLLSNSMQISRDARGGGGECTCAFLSVSARALRTLTCTQNSQ
ncbi:hypothetical protein T484DRAFT_1963299 [Baffinella frigidus]|nr:hypothetical protein T484DRAFT_1963299 [Cryptophyta sp. CCMP2293]